MVAVSWYEERKSGFCGLERIDNLARAHYFSSAGMD
jgi:hypothetical protein